MDEKELDTQFQALESDTQVQAAETSTPPPPPVRKRLTVADLKKELDELKADVDESVIGWLGELAVRLETLETTTATLNRTLLGDVKTRLDTTETGIGRLSDALRSLLEEATDQQQPPEHEIEFAQPPQQRAGGTVDVSGIAAIANVCLSMVDVLMVTRALKEVPELSDDERNEILDIACRSSGVIIAPGLQIRAGVMNVEA